MRVWSRPPFSLGRSVRAACMLWARVVSVQLRPSRPTNSFPSSSIVERPTVNRVVAGANPAMGANYSSTAKSAEIHEDSDSDSFFVLFAISAVDSRAWEHSSLPTTGSVIQGGSISRIPKKKSSTPTLNRVEALCVKTKGVRPFAAAPPKFRHTPNFPGAARLRLCHGCGFTRARSRS